ncbi:MAG: transcription antitermination factor NusB [Pseudomonadota bacterium]
MIENSPRRIAAEILIDVTDRGRTTDDAIVLSKKLKNLESSDRAFVRAMLGATLRDRGRIDHTLQQFLDRPISVASAPARALLRLGAAQSWVLNTPDHAVVSEMVDVAKSWEVSRNSGRFLNAVLRKVVEAKELFESAPIEYNWPEWLWEDLKSGLGHARAVRLLGAQRSQPQLHLTPSKISADELATLVGGQPIGLGSVELNTQNVEQIPGYNDGVWWVQDAAAALPAKLLDPRPGQRVADLCAAPGGKTMQLAAAEASVTAIDRSRPRLRRLKDNLKRVGFDHVDVIEADAEKWVPDRLYDHILLDAPCSALGTLRRHPEGAWIKSAEDIARFPEVQKRLLHAALEQVKPGGAVLYCVCSPRPQEGRDVVSDVLAKSDAKRNDFQTEEVGPFAECVTMDGDLLTIPTPGFEHDAFFISRLIRRA